MDRSPERAAETRGGGGRWSAPLGGLAALALLVLGVLGIELATLATGTGELGGLDRPSGAASQRLLEGIDASLAALNAWKRLDDPRFKLLRAEAWRQIEAAVEDLRTLSESWPDSELERVLEELAPLLDEFRRAQEDLEEGRVGEEGRGLERLLQTAKAWGEAARAGPRALLEQAGRRADLHSEELAERLDRLATWGIPSLLLVLTVLCVLGLRLRGTRLRQPRQPESGTGTQLTDAADLDELRNAVEGSAAQLSELAALLHEVSARIKRGS